ncbi:MAG: STAS domain-containing protein [Blastocatellia bacterium]|nr:STAS domain-containing protein [Blastocatellia bacterium]
MPQPFSLQVSQQAGASLISIGGHLDAHTAPEFETAIQTAVDGGQFQVIVDCTNLSYISSAGLGVFMSFIEEVREQGGDIKICGLVPKVRQVFDLLGFPDIFDLVDDVAAAVQRFAESPTRKG